MSNASNVVTIQNIEKNGSLEPKSLGELIKYADYISHSSLVPKSFNGSPADIVVAVQLGTSIGLSVAQSLQNIAVINGKPSIYGDMMLALCKRSPLCEWVKEEITGNKQEEWVATCTVKRKGYPDVVSVFSWKDAVNTKIIEKATKPNNKGWVNENSPWLTYPKRMLQMRARGFALRDAFPDLLNGFISAEEARDYPTQQDEPSVRLESKPVPPQQQTIEEMPDAEIVQEPQKSELEKDYERLSHALVAVESRAKLEKITGYAATIKLRAELEKKEPTWAGVINDLIDQALNTFDQEEAQANAS